MLCTFQDCCCGCCTMQHDHNVNTSSRKNVCLICCARRQLKTCTKKKGEVIVKVITSTITSPWLMSHSDWRQCDLRHCVTCWLLAASAAVVRKSVSIEVTLVRLPASLPVSDVIVYLNLSEKWYNGTATSTVVQHRLISCRHTHRQVCTLGSQTMRTNAVSAAATTTT